MTIDERGGRQEQITNIVNLLASIFAMREELAMGMMFSGDFETLSKALAERGIRGRWQQRADGVCTLNCVCCLYGADLHWHTDTKRVWCGGREPVRAELWKRVEAMLSETGSKKADRATSM